MARHRRCDGATEPPRTSRSQRRPHAPRTVPPSAFERAPTCAHACVLMSARGTAHGAKWDWASTTATWACGDRGGAQESGDFVRRGQAGREGPASVLGHGAHPPFCGEMPQPSGRFVAGDRISYRVGERHRLEYACPAFVSVPAGSAADPSALGAGPAH